MKPFIIFPPKRTFQIFIKHFSSSSSSPLSSPSPSALPFRITHPTLLLIESCSSMSHLKQIQSHMTRTHLILDTFPVSRLLTFCSLSPAGSLRHAESLFSQIMHPNTYIYNTMIKSYSLHKLPSSSLYIFSQMVEKRLDFDQRTFVFTLMACEQLEGVYFGECVHCFVMKNGFELNLLVVNGLIHFYGERDCYLYARRVFDESYERDVVSWTSMIDVYSRKGGLFDEGLKLFDEMACEDSGVAPNDVTMISVLSACSRKGDLDLGKRIHGYIDQKNLTLTGNINLLNALLDMYVKCGALSIAKEIFDNMSVKDTYTWTIMVNGCAKEGDLAYSRMLFNEMPKKNVVSWNAMIAGHSQNNEPKEAIDLFHDMVEANVMPIESTLVSVLSACAQSGCLDLGRWIYKHYVQGRRVPLSVILANAFIDLYSKCGSIEAAAEVFSKMSKRDLVSWNSMIVGYASHGHAKQALELFNQMLAVAVKPDDITFVGVLSACSHGGFLTESWNFFEEMEQIYGLAPKIEHYACLVDLLGRSGLPDEAYKLMKRMPMEPDIAVWGALLNGCKMQGNVELAMIAAKNLLTLDPKDSGIYVLLANICAKKRRWDDVKMVRSIMRENDVKKTPGHSAIVVEGVVHEFLAADKSNPRAEEIYRVLDEILVFSKLEENITSTFVHVDFSQNSEDLSSMERPQVGIL